MNSFRFCMSKKKSVSFCFFKDIFAGFRVLSWQFFPPVHLRGWSIVFSLALFLKGNLLSCNLCSTAGNVTSFPAFKTFSLSLTLSDLILMYLAVVFFILLVWGIYRASSNSENKLAIISSNIFCTHPPSLGTPATYILGCLKLFHSSVMLGSFQKWSFLSVCHFW